MSNDSSNKRTFLLSKRNCLERKHDFSKKGSIDEPIVDLIGVINSSDKYYTTSSCSGRITLLADESRDNLKGSVKWLYISHDFVKMDDVMNALNSEDRPKFVTFKLEPFVLHVCADGPTPAKELLNAGIHSGFKNSGLTISKSNRYIVAIRSCQSLEIPIICDKKLMVSEEYIKYIIEIANQKLSKNFEKITKFYSILKILMN